MKKLITSLTAILLIFGVQSSFAAPPVDRNSESYREQVSAQAQSYVTTNEYGEVYFDTQKAKNDGVSTDVLTIGQYVNAFSKANSEYPNRDWGFTKAGQGMFDGYRYCGYGNLGGTPTNVLDQGCKEHDDCYDARGWGKCSCDEDLKNYIKRNKDKMGFS